MRKPMHLLALAIAAALPLAATAASPAASPAAVHAKGLARNAANAAALRLASQDDLVAKDVIDDPDGTQHVRFERTYRGLPVFGGDFVMHTKAGKMKSVSHAALKTTARPGIAPKIDKDEAITRAGAAFKGEIASLPEASLVIYARGQQPRLAYRVHLEGVRSDSQDPGVVNYYIDAINGKVLLEDDQFHSAGATGTGKTLTLGNVSITTDSVSGGYQMIDPLRGSGTTLDAKNATRTNRATVFTDSDNVWGNNATSDRASAAADAHYGVAATWDYYKSVHGRNGIFDDGKGVKSYVHWGKNYFNAGWTGSYMVYGDGDGSTTYRPLVALDVAGHEMTHGVTQATAGLGYYNIKDTGGLNEATSDIFGTLVEYSIGNASDPGDYLIGEEIFTSNSGDLKALRSMFKPSDATMLNDGYDCYPSGGFDVAYTYKGGKYDPHFTSGVANHFFYLLAEGAVVPTNFSSKYTASDLVCNGDTSLAGIGREKAGKIWYKALTSYFTSTTDYPAARTATLNAAKDLYGTGSAEYNAVAKAWSAVSVN
ncbi:M4 family metallopeptidase [Luteimonas aquatica]|uniref:M4 family metallopeptidase n=1 Tax=Luteimonas aquatica TaxID=450364 RepID=UPI001F5A815C|nr:M4 family metallopeptidase [Luteimonas aquatica]